MNKEKDPVLPIMTMSN